MEEEKEKEVVENQVVQTVVEEVVKKEVEEVVKKEVEEVVEKQPVQQENKTPVETVVTISEELKMLKLLYLASFGLFLVGTSIPFANYAAIGTHMYAFFKYKESTDKGIKKWSKIHLIQGCMVIGMIVGNIVVVGGLMACVFLLSFLLPVLVPVIFVLCLPCLFLLLPCVWIGSFAFPILIPVVVFAIVLLVLPIVSAPLIVTFVTYFVGLFILYKDHNAQKMRVLDQSMELKE